MIDDPTYTRLRELSWQRKLTPAEEAELRAWLEAHPEARAEWEAENQLNTALARLPEVPVSSNFTARVLQAVERETRLVPSPAHWWGWPRLRRLAIACCTAVAFGMTLLSYLAIQSHGRKQLAQSVATVAEVSTVPSLEDLKDFDAIRVSNPSPAPDEQLLALLQ